MSTLHDLDRLSPCEYIRKHATSIAYLNPRFLKIVFTCATCEHWRTDSSVLPTPQKERKMTASRTSSATHLQLNSKPKFKAGVPPTLSRRAGMLGVAFSPTLAFRKALVCRTSNLTELD